MDAIAIPPTKKMDGRAPRGNENMEVKFEMSCDDGWGSGLGFCSDSLPKACEWRDKYHHYFDKEPVLPGIIYY